jgi:cytochrome d ubiquinol oxidase subunit II
MVLFVGLASSLYPYLLPPERWLAGSAFCGVARVFMLAGIGTLIPAKLADNGVYYQVFRGKIF